MSYHNGSVWPHDNALIAAGLARHGHRDSAMQILTGLFDAASCVNQHRLPELFCGFPRAAGEEPTLYPVACRPQTWASTAVFHLLQACLGLSIRLPERQVVFHKPALPPSLRTLTIRNLRVGTETMDLLLARHKYDVGINSLRETESEVEVLVIK